MAFGDRTGLGDRWDVWPLLDEALAGQTSPLPGRESEEHLHSSTLTVILAAPRKRGVDRHSLLGSGRFGVQHPRHGDRGTLRSPLEKLAGGNQPWVGGGLGYSRKEGCPEW